MHGPSTSTPADGSARAADACADDQHFARESAQSVYQRIAHEHPPSTATRLARKACCRIAGVSSPKAASTPRSSKQASSVIEHRTRSSPATIGNGKVEKAVSATARAWRDARPSAQQRIKAVRSEENPKPCADIKRRAAIACPRSRRNGRRLQRVHPASTPADPASQRQSFLRGTARRLSLICPHSYRHVASSECFNSLIVFQ